MPELLYEPGIYKDCDEADVVRAVRRDGFDPAKIHERPGYAYAKHVHTTTKLLAILQGTMVVIVGGQEYHCDPGDRLVTPENTPHEAFVGTEGCAFFWSEKLFT